ncbi:zinc carboxypeptidase-like [Colias croceus]|uniref:zinc carboxypeptidase-like n=1 Tax=Colias crocea TaxID=72248 RepID=UPI001E27D0A4|nr:zinc carboxypeptidase-like [Colias croceus]
MKFIYFILNAIVLCNAYKSYENYKVYKVIPSSEMHLQMLSNLRKDGYDFWTDVPKIGENVRIMVSPLQDEEFIKYVKSVGLNPELAIPNVQTLINDQLKPSNSTKRSSLGSYSWTKYHNLAEIHAWLDELVNLYPGIVSTITIGNSNEGRPIKGVIIDFKEGTRGNKPLIGMLEGGIHSREWISPATVTWIIKEFLTSDNSDVRLMAEAFVWHVFPVINPDGYEYSFVENRMWRKNRNYLHSTNCSSDDDLSHGIDLNRNFDYVWMTMGASSNPCDQTFAGPSPASEPETQAISNYVLKLKESGNMVYYIAFHSYSQMILIPYSHVGGTDVLQVENYGDLYEIATRGIQKLTQKYGTPYVTGTSRDILYEVTGSSFDWVKGVANIPIVYLFELRDVGEYGFLLPTDQIIPNNEEVMACLIEMDKTTRNLGYYYSSSGTILASLIAIMFNVVLLVVVQ